jgi:phosphatidylglycerophosphate synthase
MSWYTEYKKSLKMTEVEDYFDLFFFRPLAFILVKAVYKTNITPNQLTYTALVFGIISGYFYAQGLPHGFILGAIFFLLYNVFDCSDGQLARLKKNGTHAGRIIDGIADYIATLAVFIGIGFGYANHQENPGFWWFLIFLLAISSVIQAVLVDYYRNRFLDNVLQRKSTFAEDVEEYKAEYEALKSQKIKYIDRLIIRIYLKYCAFQARITPPSNSSSGFLGTPEEYYKKNKPAMRVWVLICSTSEITFLIICSLINRLDLFFWIVLVGFNGLALIMWFIQSKIDKSLKPSAA